MKVSLRWLNEMGKTKLRVNDAIELFSQGGIPVDGTRRLDADCERVVVGEVRSVAPHPNADRLKVTSVRLGPKETRRIVCGAPNVAAGQKVAVARPGVRLAGGKTLEAATIRGVHSDGMLCAADELGLGADHSGILVLDPRAVPGQPFPNAYGLDDVSLDLEVTPNRADCMSVVGLARDLAALQGRTFRYAPTVLPKRGARSVRVTVQDKGACPLYAARLVQGIQVRPTPSWMTARLLASGIRPISLIVDITNYVMLELGQPLHAFDAERLPKKQIIVRRARTGEKLRTLDNVDRSLNQSMLVIADATKPIALAGVMGGAETEVSPTTKDVILESALFAPSVVRKTARSLHLLSEASTRFERGIDPKMTELALDRAAKLLVELGKGRLAGGPTIVAGKLPTAKPITLGLEDLNSVLNQSFTAVKIRRWLTSLGCSVRGTTKTLLVSPPTWRVDLRLAEDLIEEVARLYGYDKLAPTHLRAELHPAPVDPLERMKERVRDLATQLGYSEVYTRETERGARVDPKEAWVIANPIDPKESVLRRSLLPNLERAAQTNLERTAETKIAVFEVGTVFAGRIERQYVGATHWRMANRFWAGDVAKGQVAYLVQALGLPEPSFRGSDICLKGADGRNEVIGTWTSTEVVLMGRNHYVRQSWEIALDALIELRSPQVFTPPQVFPTVKRDVALWVPDDLDAARLYATMQSVAPTLVAILPFDLYSKDGRRSVAFHLVFQVPDRTLTTREVDEALAAILRALEHDLKITPRR